MKINSELVWITLGFLGQVIFGGRFILQWIHSERKKESVIPMSFWYLSIIGSLILLTYAIYRKDPIFILGFSLNLIIYFRNIVLIKRKRN